MPRRYRGRDVHEWTVELGLYDQPTEAVTDPAEFREPHPMLSGGRRRAVRTNFLMDQQEFAGVRDKPRHRLPR